LNRPPWIPDGIDSSYPIQRDPDLDDEWDGTIAEPKPRRPKVSTLARRKLKADLAAAKKTIRKNARRLRAYQACRVGEWFNGITAVCLAESTGKEGVRWTFRCSCGRLFDRRVINAQKTRDRGGRSACDACWRERKSFAYDFAGGW
jgi:hypothetical protein